ITLPASARFIEQASYATHEPAAQNAGPTGQPLTRRLWHPAIDSRVATATTGSSSITGAIIRFR
ncbi:MAG TPA: hypothetical protein VFL90_05245, partial [Methylomirabilota bacterium]|nr:hypothetical protein [Methylomirabilota bacterium]